MQPTLAVNNVELVTHATTRSRYMHLAQSQLCSTAALRSSAPKSFAGVTRLAGCHRH